MLELYNLITLIQTNESVANELNEGRSEYWSLPEDARYTLASNSREIRTEPPTALTPNQLIVWNWASNFLTSYQRCVTQQEVVTYCIRRGIRVTECLPILRRHRLAV